MDGQVTDLDFSVCECKTRFAGGLRYSTMSRRVSDFLCFPKFKEELIMPFKRAASPNEDEIRSLAEGWGKVVTRRCLWR